MNYHLNAEKISLDELKKRIQETDLVPSRVSILDDLEENFGKFKKQGLKTFADLRTALKNNKNMALLRREIESYFPKPFPIKAFDWLPAKDRNKLLEQDYKNSARLFEALKSPKQRKQVAADLGIDSQIINTLFCLVALTRIQWTSPLAARMLMAAGYKNVKSVARANADKLCKALDEVNREKGFFKGKIGLRDVKRLIKSASYIN